MSKIPNSLKKKILMDPYYRTCARDSHACDGRITFEHSLIYAGKQVQELWAIIPLCAYHHAVDEFQDGGDLNKEVNEMIALMRATIDDLEKYPRNDWIERRAFLINKYRRHPNKQYVEPTKN